MQEYDEFTNNLITESEDVTGKSQIEALLYQAIASSIRYMTCIGGGLRFTRNDRTVEAIKRLLYGTKNKNKDGFLIAFCFVFCKPVIGP